MRKWLFLVLCLGLVGCASNSGVIPMGQDTYMVSCQAATGFSGSGDLKARALQEASQFCTKQGKKLQVISTHESRPPYIFANFPKAEVQFMCLDVNDPKLQCSALGKSSDGVIQAKEGVAKPDLYTELIKLEDLRKKNILTEEEFQSQKKLLLDKQK